MRAEVTDLKDVYGLQDGTVVVDVTGTAWQLEAWDSVALDKPVRERWWFTVGVKAPVSDQDLLEYGPLRVVHRSSARRSA